MCRTIIVTFMLFFCACFNSSIAYTWGGEELSIVGSDVTHVSEREVTTSTAQVLRSREFLLPTETISYLEGDQV